MITTESEGFAGDTGGGEGETGDAGVEEGDVPENRVAPAPDGLGVVMVGTGIDVGAAPSVG